MPSNYTKNYQLNQWEADDRIQRTDFNADNAKIDGALGALAARAAALEAFTSNNICYGSYEGDDTNSRTIPLPWEPKVVFLMGSFNDHNGMAVILPIVGFYHNYMSYGVAEGLIPLIAGSSLKIQDKYWFNHGTNYYIALR